MTTIKSFLAMSIAAVLAYFEPIGSLLTSLTLLFVLNFVAGLLAGLLAQRERFSFRKSFLCVTEMSVFLLILTCTFFIGDHVGDQPGALQAVSTITYTLLYFYSENILRNLRLLLPKSKAIALLHDLVSIRLLGRMPGLKLYASETSKTNSDAHTH